MKIIFSVLALSLIFAPFLASSAQAMYDPNKEVTGQKNDSGVPEVMTAEYDVNQPAPEPQKQLRGDVDGDMDNLSANPEVIPAHERIMDNIRDGGDEVSRPPVPEDLKNNEEPALIKNQVREQVKVGEYVMPEGIKMQIREQVKTEENNRVKGDSLENKGQEQNRIIFQVDKTEVATSLQLRYKENDGQKMGVTLSNKEEVDLNIMPDVAVKSAINRMGIEGCDSVSACAIELKEVSVGNVLKAAYEVQAEKEIKVLGLFRAKMQVRTEVDSASGEIIRVRKPWWSFLTF